MPSSALLRRRFTIVAILLLLVFLGMILAHSALWFGLTGDRSKPVTSPEVVEPPFHPTNLDPWPSFRGSPALTGSTAASLPSTLHLLWKIDTKDSIDSTAAIVNGRVYVGNDGGRLLCLSLADGKTLWEFTAADPIVSSPCVCNGRVFFGDKAGHFYALDAATGRQLWSITLHDKIISSPVARDNDVVVGSYDYTLNCFDAATGQSKWSFMAGAQIHASPAMLKDTVVITGCDGYLRTFLLENGCEQTNVSLAGPCAASPAVAGGHAYVGLLHGECLSIDLEKSEVDWTVPCEGAEHEISASAAIVPAESVAGQAGMPAGVVFGCKDGRVFCVDPLTGKARWTFTTKGAVESSPVVNASRVFAASNDGRLYALDVRTGARLWDFALGAEIHGSPSIGEAHLVLGNSDGALYCFGPTEARPIANSDLHSNKP